MTVAEIKKMIENMNNSEEVIFTQIKLDRDGHQVDSVVDVNNIFKKADVKINIFGRVEKN